MPPASLASGLCPQLAPIVLLVCSNLKVRSLPDGLHKSSGGCDEAKRL